jgi:hypothetical protein
MERIEFDKASSMYEAGGNCFGRLNDAGRHELASFAAEFYGDAAVDFNGLVSQAEQQSTRLLAPCVAHRIEFVRRMEGGDLRREFPLDAGYFDWFAG